jgi:hypothetical protein
VKTTTSSYLWIAGLAAGLMVSPDRLVQLGNSAGAMGTWIAGALAAGLIVHAGTLRVVRFLSCHPAGSPDVTAAFGDAFGSTAAGTIALGGRLPLAVFGSAGMLVTAGFAVNEIFWYQFPNFAFAYLLLAAITFGNLFGAGIMRWAQSAAVAAAGAGLLVLAGAGLFGAPEAVPGSGVPTPFEWHHLTVGIILLLGFDLALNSDRSADRRHAGRALPLVVAGGAVIFGLWGLAGISHLAPDKLAGSTVPHLKAARVIFGQPGRLIMGGVVILGTFAAVNALFLVISRVAGQIFAADMNRTPRAERISLISLGLAVAVCMASGMAGGPLLETFIRASLVLWLLHNMALHGAARRTMPMGRSLPQSVSMHSLFSVAGLVAAAAGLIDAEPNPLAMLGLLVTVPALGGLAMKRFYQPT